MRQLKLFYNSCHMSGLISVKKISWDIEIFEDSAVWIVFVEIKFPLFIDYFFRCAWPFVNWNIIDLVILFLINSCNQILREWHICIIGLSRFKYDYSFIKQFLKFWLHIEYFLNKNVIIAYRDMYNTYKKSVIIYSTLTIYKRYMNNK